jgi:hypothetical protein
MHPRPTTGAPSIPIGVLTMEVSWENRSAAVEIAMPSASFAG